MRSCFTYFVSFAAGIGGMIWSSVIAIAPLVAGSMVIWRGVE